MAKIENVSKFPYPEMPAEPTKEARAEILRIRAESTRTAQREILNAVNEVSADSTVGDLRGLVAEALAFLAERANGRKGTAGEGVARAPKSNIVADYFKDKDVGDKVDASDVFFDLDMDPARVLASLKRFVSSTKDVDARVWVSYDKPSRAYVVAGHGADVPKGFTAYSLELDAADAV